MTLKLNYFSIEGYSTTSTENAVFIIGGLCNGSNIAEYKNGKWTIVGELAKRRRSTWSITYGEQTMIIDPNDPTVEIWNLEQSIKSTTFERSYESHFHGFTTSQYHQFHYYSGVFLIQKDFCNFYR